MRSHFWNAALCWSAGLWIALLGAIFLVPYVAHSATLADDLIRNTVRLALGCYAIAASLMLLLHLEEWLPSGRGRLARLAWTLGWAAYLVHLAVAFHYYHHWSHADAVRHTQEVSGVGAGIYLSHLFTIIWSADVIAWWSRPGWYATRSRWIDAVLHAFMAFMIFNGTVVYERGLIRWAGVLLFAELAVVACCRWKRAVVPAVPGPATNE